MNVQTILKDLIKISSYPVSACKKSMTSMNSGEEKIAKYLESFLKKHSNYFNISKQVVAGSRYNIIASVKNFDNPRVVFFCHMDTVFPKFKQIKNGKIICKESNGRISGLGSVDMKGGMASLLSVLSKVKKPLNGLSIVFYCDEEYDFLGMKRLIKGKFNSKVAIFCEPTDLKISNGCRGLIEFRCVVKGKTAHAAKPNGGLNAIILAFDTFKKFQKIVGEYQHQKLGKTICNLAGIDGGTSVFDNKKVDNFLQIGNVIPDKAEILIEIRTANPELNGKKAINLYKKLVEDGGGNFELLELKHSHKPFFVPSQNLKLIEKAIKNSGEIVEYLDLNYSGYYDAEMFFNKFKIPCLSFGPSPAKTAHSEDEYVSISSLKKLERIYQNILEEYNII